MIITATLSIGYPTANVVDEIEIDDDLLEGMTPSQRDDYINQVVWEWGLESVETSYEIGGENE